VDIDERRCEAINSGKNPIPEEAGLDELIKEHGGNNLITTPRYEDAAGCTVFIIIVPLFVDDHYNPDFSILENAFRNVGKLLKKQDLVLLETTVPPMTTETLVKVWLEEESGLSLKLGEFYLAHSPERIMTGYSISRLRAFPKVIGGVDKESGLKAYEVYKKFIPNLHLVSNARTAEFIKIIEGCYRDVNIGLANEIFKIGNELEVDFYEAREYANHDYCHIHLPSTGVGGHCIPVYPWFLIKEMEKKEKFGYTRLLKTAREINDEMVGYWAEKVISECLRINTYCPFTH
jgi:UDP-N-acetyl-D-mannosaminuronic acid dehydrogenase